MEIRYTARGGRDILEQDRAWREHHPGRGDVFNQEIKNLLSLVSSQPRMGRRTNRYKDARVLVLRETEHLMFYRVHREHISLLALLPGRTLQGPIGRV